MKWPPPEGREPTPCLPSTSVWPLRQLPQRCEQIQREIDATDRQIDPLVYQLYGLKEEEIRIVEKATA